MKDWKRPLLYAILSLLAGALLFYLAAWLAGWLPQQIPGNLGKTLGWVIPTTLGALLGLAAGLVSWKLRQILQQEQQQRRHPQVQMQACDETSEVDTLQDRQTNTASRVYFDEYIQREWWRSVRNQKPLSMIFCGISNPTEAEKPVDIETLQSIATIFRQHIKRSADLIARFDEDKLAVLLPETSIEGAARVAEMLRNSIIEWISIQPNIELKPVPTFSLGAASCIPGRTVDPSYLIQITQNALEQAEKEGLIIVILSANP